MFRIPLNEINADLRRHNKMSPCSSGYGKFTITESGGKYNNKGHFIMSSNNAPFKEACNLLAPGFCEKNNSHTVGLHCKCDIVKIQ